MDISNAEQRKSEYNKQRYLQQKERMKEMAKNLYIRKITENPEYRSVLNERSKARHKQINEAKDVIRPRGRPPSQSIVEPKKPNGRPKKY